MAEEVFEVRRTAKEIKKALRISYNNDDTFCDDCRYAKKFFDTTQLELDALEYIEELEKRVAALETNVPKWVNPKEKLPKVPKGFKFIEVLCLYDHDGWKHCELLRFYDKKDEEFKFEPGWHQLDMFDPIMDYEDGMIGWMYLPGFPVPPEEEEAMLTEQFIANK